MIKLLPRITGVENIIVRNAQPIHANLHVFYPSVVQGDIIAV